MTKRRIFIALCVIGGVAGTLAAQQPAPKTDSVAGGPPLRIAENLYHVGASDSAVYLIVGRDGMILLDGGFEADADAILANVRSLGFDPGAMRLLIGSQAHADHAGGLAAIRARTGARMLATREDALLLERGGRDDPQFGNSMLFPPVEVDRFVSDGETVRLGDIAIRAHLTPGHTKGCTSWSLPARVEGRTLTALFVCGATAPGYRLVGNPAYPGIARDFERSFAKWRRLPCQIFLGAHGSYFDLERKRGLISDGKPNPFVDPAGCRAFLARAEKGIKDQLARERSARE